MREALTMKSELVRTALASSRALSQTPRMRLRAGTSGFSYKEWKGPFYPNDLPNAEMLRYYAERLTTVEINNTFYRMPKRSMLEGWVRSVPEARRRPCALPRR